MVVSKLEQSDETVEEELEIIEKEVSEQLWSIVEEREADFAVENKTISVEPLIVEESLSSENAACNLVDNTITTSSIEESNTLAQKPIGLVDEPRESTETPITEESAESKIPIILVDESELPKLYEMVYKVEEIETTGLTLHPEETEVSVIGKEASAKLVPSSSPTATLKPNSPPMHLIILLIGLIICFLFYIFKPNH
jgi:hypothetical protein